MSVLEILSESLGYTLSDVKEIGGYVLAVYGGLFGIALIRSVLDAKNAREEKERLEHREEIKERLEEIRLRLAEIRLAKAEAEIEATEEDEALKESLQTDEEFEEYLFRKQQANELYEELNEEEIMLSQQAEEFEYIIYETDDETTYIYIDENGEPVGIEQRERN